MDKKQRVDLAEKIIEMKTIYEEISKSRKEAEMKLLDNEDYRDLKESEAKAKAGYEEIRELFSDLCKDHDYTGTIHTEVGTIQVKELLDFEVTDSDGFESYLKENNLVVGTYVERKYKKTPIKKLLDQNPISGLPGLSTVEKVGLVITAAKE